MLAFIDPNVYPRERQVRDAMRVCNSPTYNGFFVRAAKGFQHVMAQPRKCAPDRLRSLEKVLNRNPIDIEVRLVDITGIDGSGLICRPVSFDEAQSIMQGKNYIRTMPKEQPENELAYLD